MLVGPRRFAAWCCAAKDSLADLVRLQFLIQTNATLINQHWIDILRAHDFQVGVSVDGPKDIHDTFRVDHAGRGSYDSVARGLALLRDGGVPFGVLSVIQLGADSSRIHNHFLDQGVKWIDYLLPGFTHDTVGAMRELYGPTPCADFLMPILDNWLSSSSQTVRIRIFWEMASLILGGDSRVDSFGNRPFRFVFIEADGAIESLDILRLCEDGIASTGLNVLTNDFTDIYDCSPLHKATIFVGVPLPNGCRGCPEALTCSGGYLPHRFSKDRGFDNPSVWCDDLLKLFQRLRVSLNVSVAETSLRRQVLAEMHASTAQT
jgi:uncharacterized protein